MTKWQIAGQIAVKTLKVAVCSAAVAVGTFEIIRGKKVFENVIDGEGTLKDYAKGVAAMAIGTVNVVGYGSSLIKILKN